MERKPITEESGIQKDWHERAKKMTLEDLPEFIRELTEDYEHDYGTICHAIAAAAVAAAWSVERTPQGGITGFQAGCIGWEILRQWGAPEIGELGARLLDYDNLLYPQYADKFTAISKDTLDAVQKAANDRLAANHEHVADEVVAHWKYLARGGVPFGLSISG